MRKIRNFIALMLLMTGTTLEYVAYYVAADDLREELDSGAFEEDTDSA